MQTVAIIGVGLIGGSFGLALRQAGFEGELLGVSSPAAIDAGVQTGAIHRAVSLAEAAEVADLLYLAQPVDRILSTLDLLAPMARPDCLITDAGSTKAAIVRKASESLPSGIFLGGHPMAGKEQRGVNAAEPDLFRNRPYVLTPMGISSPLESDFKRWLHKIGAQVIEMEPAKHDETVAYTSHLPQLISTALAGALSTVSSEGFPQVFGQGLVDMTRLALSTPDLWGSILATNKSQVTASLDLFLGYLKMLRDSVGTDDLPQLFEAGVTFAASLRKLSSTT